MSQIQQPGVTNGVLCIRGVDVRSKSLVPMISQHVTRHRDDSGLTELINVWSRIKDRRSLDFSWRDRFEYQLIKLDHARGQAILCQEQHTVLRRIERANGRMWLWRPGYKKFTIEATTSLPYGPQLEDLLDLEQSFIRRRKYLRSLLNHDQAPFTINILPDLGDNKEPRKEEQVEPRKEETQEVKKEDPQEIKEEDPREIKEEDPREIKEEDPQEIKEEDPREIEVDDPRGIKEEEEPEEIRPARTMQRKSSYVIPQRRMSAAHVPSTGQGSMTQDIQSEPSSPTSSHARLSRPRLRSVATESSLTQAKAQPESTIFEMGDRGLHVTFSCHDLREARNLHDQLCVLGPILLAFTASTPVHRGRLSEFDVRIKPVSRSGADYRPGETLSLTRPWRQLYPTYLSIDAPRSRITRSNTNKDVFHRLRLEGFDDAMAAFCAQGFTAAFPPTAKKEVDPAYPREIAGHWLFHKFTSSLNPHVQLELPSTHDLRTGFRVTFGAMEVQLTDFANAACIFFIGLLRFAILGFDLDFRLPPHMVAENVARAHKIDSILSEEFWWRPVRWTANGLGFQNSDQPLTTEPEPVLVKIDHIINGDPTRPETVGLSGVLDAYLADVEDSNNADGLGENVIGAPSASDNDTATISRYLAFIRRRAKGTVPTDARLMRDFISNHPAHIEDETLGATLWYDLVKRLEEYSDSALGGPL